MTHHPHPRHPFLACADCLDCRAEIGRLRAAAIADLATAAGLPDIDLREDP